MRTRTVLPPSFRTAENVFEPVLATLTFRQDSILSEYSPGSVTAKSQVSVKRSFPTVFSLRLPYSYHEAFCEQELTFELL